MDLEQPTVRRSVLAPNYIYFRLKFSLLPELFSRALYSFLSLS